MTTAGSDITKTSITATMAYYRDYYNGLIVWSASNNPFNPGQGSYGSNPAQGSASGEANSDFASDITDTNITASTLVTNFKSYATALSRIRYCRLIRWYNYNGSYGAIYDDTQVTSTGQSAYQADMSGVATSGVDSGATIQATNIDNFVQNLSNAIAANRNSTLTFNEYYCHSSCHGNCHGSI